MRIKRGKVTHRKHKKLLELTKGYRMTKSRLVKVAREAALHAGQYAYAGRKQRKRQFRRLWILRISQFCKQNGLSYSHFIKDLKKAKIFLNRKILSDLIVNDTTAFQAILDKVKNI